MKTIPQNDLSRQYNMYAAEFPVTERYAKEILSLPMFNGMTEEEITRVVATVNDLK